ncbi:MAG: ABC transporter ATP-binding protein [Aquihabitans sp.]
MTAATEEPLDRRVAGKVLRRALRFLAPYRRDAVGSFVFVVMSTSAILAGPYLLRYAIDHGISQNRPAVVNVTVGIYVVVAVVAYWATRTQVLLVSRAGEGFMRDLRKRVFDHLLALSMPFFDREKAGVVVSRMTSDVDQLQELVQLGFLQLMRSLLLISGSIVVLTLISWKLMLLCLIPMPFVVLASVKFQRDSNAAYLTVRDRIGLTLSSLQEGISGVRIIQAYGRESVEIERFAGRNRGLYQAHMRSVWVQAWYLPVIEAAALLCTALVIGIGGRWAIEGTITVGTIAFFVLTLSNLFEPVNQLSQLFNTLQSSGAALHKLFELLDTPVELVEQPDAVELPARGELKVEGMSFAYDDGPPVLTDIDLTLASGEKLALVGPTGAGKSTLAKLMARLYDPTAGRVTFEGIDLRDAQLSSLRTRITVVPQEGYLFAASLLDNIRIGRPDATDEEVEQALASLGLLDRFAALPDGLHTEVNERGSRLSAGERQLVSLCRAALADPAVLVLDEATSSLDPGTEAVVERALEKLMAGRSVIVIAHRLSTAARSDRVGVVADGGLAELGPHAELVAAGGRYASLYENWVSGLASA